MVITGIGRSLAGSLVGHGCFVIAVGRRQEHLDSLVETYGKDKVAILQFDISQLDKIPSFVKRFGPLLPPGPTPGYVT
jgi:NADP-dependent 3-hydroxy acid dehydrogenase YdfG